MKTLLQPFEDEVFEKLKIAKRKTGLTWHDFIIKKCLE